LVDQGQVVEPPVVEPPVVEPPVVEPPVVEPPVVEPLDSSSNQNPDPVPDHVKVLDEVILDMSASEALIQQIDEVLQTIPEDPVQSAIAKLWLPPPGRSPVVLGAPMSRATMKG
jgi:hypothetical protein